MIDKKKLFKVPNSNSNDANIKEVIYKINKSLLERFINNQINGEYLCICSGGTTSSCAKNNLITVDLRKKYNQIELNKETGNISIGGGVLMGDLIKNLDKSNRTFPIGLSTLPGIGYILTGGISPLSRRYGLAIDNIVSVKGFLGNGEYFSLNEEKLIEEKEINLWEGIKGAAPFFSIITEIGLKTYKSYPIKIVEGFINKKELEELIIKSEDFPQNMSIQWIFSDQIYVYIVMELKTEQDKILAEKYKVDFNTYSSLKIREYKSFNHVSFFPKELNLFELNPNYHSEVISLLGNDLKNSTNEFIEALTEINFSKPNKSCYVASQQCGLKNNKINNSSSFFVHRECSWKPWIYASWEKNNYQEKNLALIWMNQSWGKLKRFFPYIHMAQLHNHLSSHKEEINLAFGHKLKNLKLLKNFYDPANILPPL
tara:strand:- start:133 stop:1416 length:1284 start_codon:yes stop_codon:yes gene_type:complete